jgi:hypothetical protein
MIHSLNQAEIEKAPGEIHESGGSLIPAPREFQNVFNGTTSSRVPELKSKDRSIARAGVAMTVEERLEKIEAMLVVLVERQMLKAFYEIEEFARLVGKSCFTCREWCRHARIRAEKKLSGRGAYARWVVPHAELLRYQKEGLLPIQRLA